VAGGKLNKQVAAELGVSEVMVKVHRANGMRKMHVASLAKLVRVIDQLGVEPGDTPVRDSKSVAAPRKAPIKDHEASCLIVLAGCCRSWLTSSDDPPPSPPGELSAELVRTLPGPLRIASLGPISNHAARGRVSARCDIKFVWTGAEVEPDL